jgi:hypothetical protein
MKENHFQVLRSLGSINTILTAVGGEDIGHISAQKLELSWRTILNTVVNLREICQRDEQPVIGGGAKDN